MRFFFDVRNDGTVVTDETGLDLFDLQSAASEAASVLAERAEDMFSGVLLKQLSIEVRNSLGTTVLIVTLLLEVIDPVLPILVA